MNQEDADTRWLGLAIEHSESAECQKRKVGALVILHDRVVGQGFSHDPTGEKDCRSGECPRAFTDTPANTGDYDLCINIHAEAAAIVNAGRLTRGATMYVTSLPCAGCLKLIYAAGIRRYVHPGGELPL